MSRVTRHASGVRFPAPLPFPCERHLRGTSRHIILSRCHIRSGLYSAAAPPLLLALVMYVSMYVSMCVWLFGLLWAFSAFSVFCLLWTPLHGVMVCCCVSHFLFFSLPLLKDSRLVWHLAPAHSRFRSSFFSRRFRRALRSSHSRHTTAECAARNSRIEASYAKCDPSR